MVDHPWDIAYSLAKPLLGGLPYVCPAGILFGCRLPRSTIVAEADTAGPEMMEHIRRMQSGPRAVASYSLVDHGLGIVVHAWA